MATVVLTAVGTALGGPIGGALGALAGRAVDARLMRAPTREGPRLSELRVQTSSYGSPIAALFGTMRVAGTVIWSTDLREHRQVMRAAKGQPGVAQYSYTASFAVLLSARAISRVGRVWADGQLVRGAAGDWKVATGFRVHAGGEDQVADPLIAAAEGIGLAPAHRGCAYAVFEDMALASFGNRIPSLTFEVVADDGAVEVGAVARAIAPEVRGGGALTLDGFASGGGTVAAVLDCLADMSGAWFAPTERAIAMRTAAAPAVMAVEQTGRGGGREVAAIDAVPKTVTVGHYDPARDWQAGLQRARRPGAGERTLAIEAPAALSASAAKSVATAALARGEAARVRRTAPVALDALRLAPGDVVALAGEAGRWRVEAVMLEGMATTLTLTPLPAETGAMTATPGRVLAQPDRPIGATLLVAAELPALGDALLTQPRVLAVAAGTGAGWRTAPLLLSVDDGASWAEAGATAAAGVIGRVVVPPAAGALAIVDRAGSIEVVLARADMALGDADDAALDRGGNLALVGDELIQFGSAEPLGGGRWRLRRLWRGRRGTIAAAGLVGARFALLEADSVRAIDVPLASLGKPVLLMAAGVGDGAAPPVTTVAVTGASILPPAPVGLCWTPTADGGALVRWTRRSRAGWRWLDRVDAPLGEERERYRVGFGDRSVFSDGAQATIPADVRTGGPLTVRVVQCGTFGESAPATIMVEGL